ncbi:HNH endonuclease signature motif containing protein [Zobellella denitrificans]|uniref:HNH endonuclease signature motif containing protein n=1 Tax=Zobellella denitrificans TaxID=347534 RepID=UPI000BBE20A1|nr:HNH endonuclease signature motif containing protein [Zobellella denitrificans]
MNTRFDWTPEHIAWVKVRPHITRRRLCQMFNAHFGTDLGYSAFKSACTRYGCKSANDGRFQKGQNKHPGSGAKGPNAGTFRAGNMPHNHNPIGHVRYNDRYMEVKLTDTRCSRRDYRPVHLLVWEHYHGTVPKGHIVTFKNGDIYDFDIDNLELITRAEHAVRCKFGYYNTPVELRPAMDLVIKLKIAASRRANPDRAPRAGGAV